MSYPEKNAVMFNPSTAPENNHRQPNSNHDAHTVPSDHKENNIQGINRRLTQLEGTNKQAQDDLNIHMQNHDNLLEKMLKIQSARPNAADPRTELMSSITLIAGFLVVAAFPIVTQDLSSNSAFRPTHFAPESVRIFAAISVGLFLTVIMLCQGAKLMLVARGDGQGNSKAVKPAERKSRGPGSIVAELLHWIMIELLALAILFLLLIMAAYVWVPGLIFVVTDGLFALIPLGLIVVGFAGGVK